MERRPIATDLDRTLLPDGRLSGSPGARGETSDLNRNDAAEIGEGVLHYHPAWSEVVRNQA